MLICAGFVLRIVTGRMPRQRRAGSCAPFLRCASAPMSSQAGMCGALRAVVAAPIACQSSDNGRDGYAHMRRFCAADYHRANAAAEAIRFVCAGFALRVHADEQSSRDVRRAQGGCAHISHCALSQGECRGRGDQVRVRHFCAARYSGAFCARPRPYDKIARISAAHAPRAARFLIFPRRPCQPPVSGSRPAIHAQAIAGTKPSGRKPHCGRQRGAATDSASPRARSHSLRSMPICTASI